MEKNLEHLKKQASLMNIGFNVKHDPDFITITVNDMVNGNGMKHQMTVHMFQQLRYPDDAIYEIIFNLILSIVRKRLESNDNTE